MELNVYDRLILLNVLPREGDITTLRIIRSLREELSFSEEEHKALQFKQDGEKVTWKTEAGAMKDVRIGEKANDIIKERLEELNRKKKLTDSHMSLYERFVEAK